MIRRVLLVVAAAILAGAVVPEFTSGPNLDQIALALALAGPACGAALAAGVGRPLLAASALAGVGSYISAIASVRGVPVPLAVLCGCAGGLLAGVIVAGVAARLDATRFLVATVLVTLALGDGVQALPGITGGQAGLAPLPPISVTLGGRRTLALTPRGDFHLLLVVAVVITVVGLLLERGSLGSGWRAVGSDRARAADTGLHPLAAEIGVLAVAGAMSGVCGALGAHINQVASPSQFGVYAGALPLLAALVARREPLIAALLAVATGLLGGVVLPSLGWKGPPTAQSVALAALALAALLALLPSGESADNRDTIGIDPDAPWPVDRLGLRGATLDVRPITCRSRSGAVLVDAPAFRAEPGKIHAIVGPNGSGKSTLMREVTARSSRGAAGVTVEREGVPGRLVLLPQDGGGFANCSVVETLHIAARRGRSSQEARVLSSVWLSRIGLEAAADRNCSELSGGQRRMLDLARVLLGSPDAVLCDEPLAGLDDDHRAAATGCLAAAAAAGLTVVISEHDREAVERLATSVTELERDANASSLPAPAAS